MEPIEEALFSEVRKQLPDSRLVRRDFREVSGPLGLYQRCYCVNCGVDGGLTIGFEFFLYLCQKCAETYGVLALPEIPEDLIRGN